MASLAKIERSIPLCRRCPRLVSYRKAVASRRRAAFRLEKYWGKPVPGFGDRRTRLLVVGLAPAAHGGNRTGRMFTGDGSAGTLMRAMHCAGFANQPVSERREDGLALKDAYVTAVVKCTPPGNRPSPGEIGQCRIFLAAEIAALPRLRAVLALGRTAFGSVLSLLVPGRAAPRPVFRHGAVFRLPGIKPAVFASYHPSRRNTQTGLLTGVMLDSVFRNIKKRLRAAKRPGWC